MDEKALKNRVIMGFSFSVIVIIIIIGIKVYYNRVEEVSNITLIEKDSIENRSYLKMVKESNVKDVLTRVQEYNETISTIFLTEENAESYLKHTYLKLEKPNADRISIAFEDNYMQKSISLTLSGVDENIWDSEKIKKLNQGKKELVEVAVEVNDFYEEKETKSFYDLVLSVMNKYSDTKYHKTIHISMQLDHVYVYRLYEDEKYIYIELINPHELYESVIVVDAGHGGEDSGTCSAGIEYQEKDFNLNILIALKELLEKENIKVYYTRLTDEKVYLRPRVELANDLQADVFISIHCNAVENDTTVNGTEVLYHQNQKDLKMNSEELAEICLEEIVKEIGTAKRGLVEADDKYIIGHATVPVALIEVGFLTNPQDLEFIKQEKNQKKVAKGVYNAIIRALDVLESKK